MEYSKTKVTTKRVLVTAFVVDVADIIMNLSVALISGSAVVLAKMLQGFADLAVDVMLLVGFSRSRRHPTKRHPFGYGKEMYFWSIMAGIFIFFVTATLAIYFGWKQIVTPDIISNLWVAYTVISIGVVSNIYTFSVSYRRLMAGRSWRKVWHVFSESPQAAVKTTFVTDLMGSTAAVIGLVALISYGVTGNLLLDGAGAVVIGVALGVSAIVLLFGLKELVIGRVAPPATEKLISETLLSHHATEDILDLKTMVIGPDKLLVNAEVHLRDELNTDQIEKIMDELKESVQERVPQTAHIQIEPETPSEELG